MQYQY